VQSGALMTNELLRRVTRANPCAICGRGGWCSVSAGGHIAICMRQSEGAVKRSANGGYIHVLRDDPFRRDRPMVRTVRIEGPRRWRPDIDGLARQYQAAVTDMALRGLAHSLGLSVESLGRLRVGWDGCRRAWAFPMADPNGQVLGIRLRFHDGRKLSVAGGHEGLFIPMDLTYRGLLLVAEGPTDTAALLDLGFDAVGRPSCVGGVAHCIALVLAHWPLDVIIVADGDSPGERGAEVLASSLLAFARTVRVVHPPAGIKDVRIWKHCGATRADVDRAIEAAPLRKLAVRCRATGIAKGR